MPSADSAAEVVHGYIGGVSGMKSLTSVISAWLRKPIVALAAQQSQ